MSLSGGSYGRYLYFFAGRHQRRSCRRQVVDCRHGCTHIEIAGIELAQRMKIPPDILQVPESNGGGGRTRTYDLRIMRPSL